MIIDRIKYDIKFEVSVIMLAFNFFPRKYIFCNVSHVTYFSRTFTEFSNKFRILFTRYCVLKIRAGSNFLRPLGQN